MGVDKFGRHLSGLKLRHSLPFRLTNNGNNDVQNKIIHNVGDMIASTDGINLSYMQKTCLPSTDANNNESFLLTFQNDAWSFSNFPLSNVGRRLLDSDAVNFKFMRENAIILQDESFNAGGKKIVNVEYGTDANDAVNVWQFGAHVNYTTWKLNTLYEAIDNAVILREGLYNAGGYKITGENVKSGSSYNDVVNVRQLIELRWYTERELNKLQRPRPRRTYADTDSMLRDEE